MSRIEVPTLDIDRRLQEGRPLRPDQVLERRIVAHLFDHLGKAGWKPSRVNDGETRERASDLKSAMELIFNLDEAWVEFVNRAVPGGRLLRHSVFLVLGNGEDIVSDWTYFGAKPHVGLPEDWDGFGKVMDAFKVEEAF